MSDIRASSKGRGSQWHKWDLQVHTPFSYLNNQFGTDFIAYAAALFEKAYHNKVSVIGVTDYFTIEGFRKLKRLQNDPTPLADICAEEYIVYGCELLLLPNVELRLDQLIEGRRINLHVIFSEEVCEDDIEDRFLNQLKFDVETGPESPTERWPLKKKMLAQYGELLQSQHETFSKEDALKIGMQQASVALSDVQSALQQSPSIFSGRYLIAVPPDEDLSRLSWHGQAHSTRKRLLQASHLLFSSNENTRRWAIGEKSPSKEQFREEFRDLKLCIPTSDSHKTEDLFQFPLGRDAWLCCELTFSGLRQCVNEPSARSYVGTTPPKLQDLASNPSRYIDQIAIRPKSSTENAGWFDVELPVNPGLVAIIGNKGSGKSALLDCAALAGNSHAEEEFSFLNRDRFCKRPQNLASKFETEVTWASGEVISIGLDEKTDHSKPRKVEYLPQSYIENICTEISDEGPVRFSRELEQVVFRHLPEDKRQKANNFRELVSESVRPFRDRAEQARSELKVVNEKIVDLEDRLSSEWIARLKYLENQRLEELREAWQGKPRLSVKSRAAINATDKQVEEHAARLRKRARDLDARLKRVRRIEKAWRQYSESAIRLSRVGENVKAHIENTIQKYCEDFYSVDLDPESFISLSIQWDKTWDKQEQANRALERVHVILGSEKGEGLLAWCARCNEELQALQRDQSAIEREFDSELANRARWKKRVWGLLNDEESGLRKLRREISVIQDGTLDQRLEDARRERARITQRIAEAIENERKELEELYQPVAQRLWQEELSVDEVPLNFAASIIDVGLVDGFLSYINQGRRGTFSGSEEGRQKASGLVEECFDNTAGTLTKVAEALEQALRADLREDEGHQPTRNPDDQIKGSASRHELYNFLYGLEKFAAIYEIRWGEKRIERLSPGERGVLLLVFHLVLSPEGTPLLIDQPEGNLDNETIYNTLVSAIKSAAEHRQVIIVTHNPNLAIVCDANQIIVAEIVTDQNNTVVYKSGSIESVSIAASSVDILEGTWPAFDVRGSKYGLHR
ncbi:ATPase [Halorhodospira halochloris]|uniref:ATPase n=1 Tax=Halorhodospira halochloris TaxID=1052 RepID=A0A110B5W1_HALHR|nr:ATP-binding protein [Halorhodospira halochloris]MBK1652989.1 hypothetical protein [Halorhodospira halochloris]BAU58122.1 ATPase [Halorhodospira halochloris]